MSNYQPLEDININDEEDNNLNNQNNQNNDNQNQNLPNQDEEEEEEEEIFDKHADSVLAILRPVAITMFLVIFIVKLLSGPNQQVSIVLAYNEQASDSAGTKLLGSLINAVIFVALITVTTIVFVLLYKYRCMKVIYGWLILATILLLAMFGGLLAYFVLDALNLPMDFITLSIILWNFTIVGILSIFWYAPAIINKAYLIIISALMAVFFTRIPEWTTWALLGAIALYDVFAVLCPRGPLRVLVDISQQRQENIPALLYNGSIFIMMVNEDLDDKVEIDEEPTGRGIKLGLGDFVFYSVLVGRAAMFDMITVFTCFIAIITGLFFTLILLGIFRKALPALPISIALGIIFFITTSYFLVPFILLLGSNSIFV
eukprot:TRINITY_DN123_c2_g1_i1.p1 TRINITY_DN123_c2_g1~~TRINITY_DN123_c2_g1_i1.p1  ORF type:complete len:373 (-),score=97.84 TRINITY_DN123_c2_g1_i1:51-1169(-)